MDATDAEFDFTDPRTRLRICRSGFGLSGLALAVLSFDAAIGVVAFWVHGPLRQVVASPIWSWILGTPITWGSLIGSLILWGAWSDAGWRRRLGPLIAMNTIDAFLWAMSHAQELGLDGASAESYAWIRALVGLTFGWIELQLFASLAAEVAAHYKAPEAIARSQAPRAICRIGLMLTGFIFAVGTDFTEWPFTHRLTVAGVLLQHFASIILAIASYHVAMLCLLAARQCRQELQALDEAESDGLPPVDGNPLGR